MTTYYIPKNVLKTRSELNTPDKFVNLKNYIQEETFKHVIPFTVTLTDVAADDAAYFVVPAQMNGLLIEDIIVRYITAGTGQTGATTVDVYINGVSVLSSDISIAANANTHSAPAFAAARTLSTGDVVQAKVVTVGTGGTDPVGCLVTIVTEKNN